MKSQEISNIIIAIDNAYTAIKKARATLEENGKNNKGEVLTEKNNEALALLSSQYKNSRESMIKAIARLKAFADKNQANVLAQASDCKDFELLKLPVILTKEELTILIERNITNTLFLRAVEQYANKNKMEIELPKGKGSEKEFALEVEASATKYLPNYTEPRAILGIECESLAYAMICNLWEKRAKELL